MTTATRHSARQIIDFANDIEFDLYNAPVKLRDIRQAMARIEVFAKHGILERSTLGTISEIVASYYPLGEYIALFQRERDVYAEHVRKGDLDGSHDKVVRLSGVYGLCWRWLDRHDRYPYGDVRLLEPIIGEVLLECAQWEHIPYPEQAAKLEAWHRELAPGGALYPSAEHLAYVARFEAFAEDLVWDSRDRDYITIVNFPAPPNALPPTVWWCTQHVLST